MIESFDQALEALDDDRKVAVFQKIAELSQSKNNRDREQIMFGVDESIARVVAIFHLEMIRDGVQESKKEKLKKREEPIRETAIEILLTLIRSSNPDQNDARLVDRAIKMAKQIHEHF
jgi:hypothetical protein